MLFIEIKTFAFVWPKEYETLKYSLLFLSTDLNDKLITIYRIKQCFGRIV